MKLCSKCKKRPAVVFIGDAANPGKAPNGLCLVCAKEAGIKPIDDMLKSMNISDENIEELTEQMMEAMGGMLPEEMMSLSEDGEAFDEDEGFEGGGAPVFPFLNQIFGGAPKSDKTSDKSDKNKSDKKKKSKHKYLDMYCTNFTKRARNGEIDAIVGRDEELYRTIQILSRRSKNNPCLIGEPGVGKTAIVEGLAMKIATGDAPARLLDQEVWLLDLTGLVAGTQFRGQFESRVKGLVEEIKAAGNIILFIDEVHNIVGAGNSEGAMNAGNILKPALSRGEIHVIGATTLKEYRQYIEKDAALERRFQPVMVEEPSFENTLKILECVRPYYEGFHNIKISDDILKSAVTLSERYITDRYLPDKAIDLIDEASACAALRNKAIDELYSVNKKIAELSVLEEQESASEEIDYEKIAKIKSELAVCKTRASELYEPAADNTVTADDLARVIELWTGIPASKVKESDLKKLVNLTDELKLKVKGQDEAVELVSSAVKRSRLKISKNKRPASFIFVGPTGVGKTELAKVLADSLFQTPETLLRFDMSEFMEKHSVSRLIGAPPGYVGYDEAGQLTEKVRRKPYSVILFDEIEKAHPDVLNVMLQILDDGRITDAQGRTVNFENTIIIMTSNAGSDRSENLMGFGKSTDDANTQKAIKALEEFLRPEFISRVDEIVVFSQLKENALEDIAKLALDELSDALKDKSIILEVENSVYSHFAKRCSGSKRGARDLRNFVRKDVEDKIITDMIENGDKQLSKIAVKIDKDLVKLTFKYN